MILIMKIRDFDHLGSYVFICCMIRF